MPPTPLLARHAQVRYTQEWIHVILYLVLMVFSSFWSDEQCSILNILPLS